MKRLKPFLMSYLMGFPDERISRGASRKGGGSAFSIVLYGVDQWKKLFTRRQLSVLGVLLCSIRATNEQMNVAGFPEHWNEAVRAYLVASLNRLVDQCTTLCTWYLPGENVKHTYVRHALPNDVGLRRNQSVLQWRRKLERAPTVSVHLHWTMHWCNERRTTAKSAMRIIEKRRL